MSSCNSDEAAGAVVVGSSTGLQDAEEDVEESADLEATVTIAMQPEQPCACDKDRGVAVIKLTGDPGSASEVQLVAKHLIAMLKKQGILNQVCCACTSPTKTVTEPCDGEGDDWEELGARVPQQQDAEEVDEESLEDDQDDDEEEEEDSSSDGAEDLQRHNEFVEMQRRVTLDLRALSRQGPLEMTTAKVTLLAPHMLRPVRKLINLYCEPDGAWVMQLLCDLAPQLEELQLVMPSRTHLEVMATMPQLSRLCVEYFNEEDAKAKTKAPAEDYTFRRPPSRHCGLRFLKVGHMPKKTTFSLIRAHRRTLEELWLCVGSGLAGPGLAVPVTKAERWPEGCRDLHERLRHLAGEGPLKRLVLFRWLYAHHEDACFAQMRAVRRRLRVVEVLCFECDRMSCGEF